MSEPTEADYEAALRLSREYIYDGAEPYAPAVSSFARMLAAHREEVQRDGRVEIMRAVERWRQEADALIAEGRFDAAFTLRGCAEVFAAIMGPG